MPLKAVNLKKCLLDAFLTAFAVLKSEFPSKVTFSAKNNLGAFENYIWVHDTLWV